MVSKWSLTTCSYLSSECVLFILHSVAAKMNSRQLLLTFSYIFHISTKLGYSFPKSFFTFDKDFQGNEVNFEDFGDDQFSGPNLTWKKNMPSNHYKSNSTENENVTQKPLSFNNDNDNDGIEPRFHLDENEMKLESPFGSSSEKTELPFLGDLDETIEGKGIYVSNKLMLI